MEEAFRLNSRDARNTERTATIAVSKTCTNRKINEEDTRVWDATSHGSTMQSLTSNNMLQLVSFPEGKTNVRNVSQCQNIAQIAKRTKRTREIATMHLRGIRCGIQHVVTYCIWWKFQSKESRNVRNAEGMATNHKMDEMVMRFCDATYSREHDASLESLTSSRMLHWMDEAFSLKSTGS